jgi:sarcosine oxidase subunit alpha
MMDSVSLKINGRSVSVKKDTIVAAAVFQTGASNFRTSVNGEPRAPLCGMGICFECRVTIDGIAHKKSCQIVVSEGMEVITDGNT